MLERGRRAGPGPVPSTSAWLCSAMGPPTPHSAGCGCPTAARHQGAAGAPGWVRRHQQGHPEVAVHGQGAASWFACAHVECACLFVLVCVCVTSKDTLKWQSMVKARARSVRPTGGVRGRGGLAQLGGAGAAPWHGVCLLCLWVCAPPPCTF